MDNDIPRHKSTLADHSNIREVLPRFVVRLRAHVHDLRQFHREGDMEKLRIQVHQIRGVGTAFGFEPLTVLAGAVEERIFNHAPAAEISAALDALVGYMENIEGF